MSWLNESMQQVNKDISLAQFEFFVNRESSYETSYYATQYPGVILEVEHRALFYQQRHFSDSLCKKAGTLSCANLYSFFYICGGCYTNYSNSHFVLYFPVYCLVLPLGEGARPKARNGNVNTFCPDSHVFCSKSRENILLIDYNLSISESECTSCRLLLDLHGCLDDGLPGVCLLLHCDQRDLCYMQAEAEEGVQLQSYPSYHLPYLQHCLLVFAAQ